MTTSPDNGIAIVTGAGGGLGRALAVELMARGMAVAGIGRDGAALAQTAGQGGGRFVALVADVADPAAVEAAFARLDAEGLVPRILINNAAVYDHADFLTAPPAYLDHAMAVNFGGTVTCTRAALQRMVQAGGRGRIVNVATFADLAPLPGSMAYSVSKGAARIFTRALVADIGDRLPDIVVNDWIPGALATRMGIADGIAPETAARWGAALALWHDRSLQGATFERDREVIAPRSLKRRIKDRLLFKPAPVARRLA